MGALSIAHLTNSFRSDGTGITNVVADLAAAQADRGHRAVVVCDGSDAAMRELAAKDRFQIVDGVSAQSVREVWRSAQDTSPLLSSADVIPLHTVRGAVLGMLAAPACFLRSSVATVHNPYQRSTAVMLAARVVVAISDVDARAVRRPSARLRRARVITNGVLAFPRMAPLAEVTARPLPPKSVVFVGGLSERKGLDVLLRAMTQVVEAQPSSRLYVVGNRDNPALEGLADRLGLGESVSIEGFSADPRGYLLSAAAFVLPSRAEGFPLALLEARGCGVPIVASRVGGIPQDVDDGAAALLVAPDDVQALAAGLISVLADDAVADRLRAAGRLGAERYTVQRMTDDYLLAYRTRVSA